MAELEYGRSEEYHGINLIFDPEKYVDSGIKLKYLCEVINKLGDHV